MNLLCSEDISPSRTNPNPSQPIWPAIGQTDSTQAIWKGTQSLYQARNNSAILLSSITEHLTDWRLLSLHLLCLHFYPVCHFSQSPSLLSLSDTTRRQHAVSFSTTVPDGAWVAYLTMSNDRLYAP